MSLTVFRSKAAGEFYMFAETARRIFVIIGKEPTPKGVITTEQLPDALAKLTAAVDEEKQRIEVAEQEAEPQSSSTRPITLGQRAFPLIEMMRAAQKKNVDVTWGV